MAIKKYHTEQSASLRMCVFDQQKFHIPLQNTCFYIRIVFGSVKTVFGAFVWLVWPNLIVIC